MSQKMRRDVAIPCAFLLLFFKRFACGLAAVSSDIPARFRLTDERLTLLSLSVVSGLVEAILRLITAATTNNFGLLWQTVNPQINR